MAILQYKHPREIDFVIGSEMVNFPVVKTSLGFGNFAFDIICILEKATIFKPKISNQLMTGEMEVLHIWFDENIYRGTTKLETFVLNNLKDFYK